MDADSFRFNQSIWPILKSCREWTSCSQIEVTDSCGTRIRPSQGRRGKQDSVDGKGIHGGRWLNDSSDETFRDHMTDPLCTGKLSWDWGSRVIPSFLILAIKVVLLRPSNAAAPCSPPIWPPASLRAWMISSRFTSARMLLTGERLIFSQDFHWTKTFHWGAIASRIAEHSRLCCEKG